MALVYTDIVKKVQIQKLPLSMLMNLQLVAKERLSPELVYNANETPQLPNCFRSQQQMAVCSLQPQLSPSHRSQQPEHFQTPHSPLVSAPGAAPIPTPHCLRKAETPLRLLGFTGSVTCSIPFPTPLHTHKSRHQTETRWLFAFPFPGLGNSLVWHWSGLDNTGPERCNLYRKCLKNTT